MLSICLLSCFFGVDTEKKPNIPFSGKMCVPLNALFSRKYRFPFRSETENERAERAELRSGGRTPVRRAGGAKPRQAKPLPKPSKASERRREASEARRPSQGRASEASEHLPTK